MFNWLEPYTHGNWELTASLVPQSLLTVRSQCGMTDTVYRGPTWQIEDKHTRQAPTVFKCPQFDCLLTLDLRRPQGIQHSTVEAICRFITTMELNPNWFMYKPPSVNNPFVLQFYKDKPQSTHVRTTIASEPYRYMLVCPVGKYPTERNSFHIEMWTLLKSSANLYTLLAWAVLHSYTAEHSKFYLKHLRVKQCPTRPCFIYDKALDRLVADVRTGLEDCFTREFVY